MDVAEIAMHMRIDGFCVIPGVIPKDDVPQVLASVERTTKRLQPDRFPEDGEEPAQWTDPDFVKNGKEARPRGLLNHDQSFVPYLVEPRLKGALEALLGPHYLAQDCGAAVGIGSLRRGLHTDWPYNQRDDAAYLKLCQCPPEVPVLINTLWMLTPFNQETGATAVVPGSHTYGKFPGTDFELDRSARYPTELQATGEAGSVLMLDGRTWHSIMPNNSGKRRSCLILRWIPWWFNMGLCRDGSLERKHWIEDLGMGGTRMEPLVKRDVYERLPSEVKPLYRHWVES